MAKNIRKEWSKFYHAYFDKEADFSKVSVPRWQRGFNRVLFIPRGLTIDQAFQACQRAFPSWAYTTKSLDRAVRYHDRNTKKSYAVRVRDYQEADEKLYNLSANQLRERDVKTITLLERLIYGLKYFAETGEHLDVRYWTLCAGSRTRYGKALYARWRGGEFGVNWCLPDQPHAILRARQVVV